MSLKRYQERVVREFDLYFEQLRAAQAAANPYASLSAWKSFRAGQPYTPQETGDGRDLPWVALKVPTGGGKTLLATQILAGAHRHWLRERNGAGLVVWVVVSDQIYRDTLKALRDRNHLYRASLESALSRRIEVWEKDSIARLTPSQLAENLNILVIKLQGANRQDKESLKFFRDTGGLITRHFPAEDDGSAHAALLEETTNLETFEPLGRGGERFVKTSLANLVRLCRPVVIVDEGQRAASQMARDTIRGFNPTLVVELSATPPPDVPQLSIVSGQELLDEEMIKLPINVATETGGTWAHCLTKAHERRRELEAKAREFYAQSGRFIRPIVLVQVERTGKDQRTPNYIHAEDAFDYLTQSLGVPIDRVKIKTSDRDDIEGIDLMAEECPVEWIITKQALQEGWDCPFAYILVSLNNTQSVTAMTQLAGRVLRQPFQAKTPFTKLNESYVHCLHRSPFEIIKAIRAALANEGYEGDRAAVIDLSEPGAAMGAREAVIRPEFSVDYGQPKPGRILLPRFHFRTDAGKVEIYDYFMHSLPIVDFAAFEWEKVRAWNLLEDLEAAREIFHRIHLHDEALEPLDMRTLEKHSIEADKRSLAWLVANLNMDWLSAKQLRRLSERAYGELLTTHGDALRDKLSLVRFALVERLKSFIQSQCDEQSEARFEEWLEAGRISFNVEPVEFAHAVPERKRLKRPPMTRNDGYPLQRSLFDTVEDVGNDLERDVALSLDASQDVRWWYRNMPEPGRGFWIQGPRRARIYPDFIVRRSDAGHLLPCVLLFESKGEHLGGNEDTQYKKRVARYFSQIGELAQWQEVTWRDSPDLDSAAFRKHRFMFEVIDKTHFGWRDQMQQALAGWE